MSRIRRSFSAEFKAQVVLQYLSGEASQAELCRKHNLKPNLIANWKAAVLDQGLTLAALERALVVATPKMHHSDQGVPYAATAYVVV